MRAYRDATALAARSLIEPAAVPAATRVAARYAIGVSEDIAALIDPADPLDPIARQYLPDSRELTTTAEERADPIGDAAHSPCEGLVHRYPDRVLLKLVDACAVYCRFCFRRESVGPGGGGALSSAALDAAMAYIAARPAIWEVILTGGDPLATSSRRLADVAERLAAIDHVKILRVHTRLPVAMPDRVCSELGASLMGSGKTVYVAVHANHPRELTPAARAACGRLAAAGCVLVSQSVLLRGVNDDAQVLADLMRGFVEAGIRPYYLHHPDLAPGTSHFRLSLAEGQALVAALRGRISGLCQPHYVLDIPGGYGKVPVGPTYLTDDGRVRDWRGGMHSYPAATAAD